MLRKQQQQTYRSFTARILSYINTPLLLSPPSRASLDVFLDSSYLHIYDIHPASRDARCFLYFCTVILDDDSHHDRL